MKPSIIKSPKTAMALYINIYCQKQDKTKDKNYVLMEATKSWVSLSKTDKKYFLNVFKEYKTQMTKNFASKLQNAELYMKKKHVPKRLNKSTSTIVDYNQSVNKDPHAIQSMINITAKNSDSVPKDEHIEGEIQHNNEELENYNTSSLESITDICEEPDVPKIISEPTPPMRSSMELFEMVKYNDELTESLSWTDLTKLQKQRYQRALLSIKNDYIKRYTAYLEQLTPEQLFRHYKYKS